MIRPGARNLVTDVPGILVGNAGDAGVRSGVTAILPESESFVCAVDVRGGAPGTRETDALRPECLVPEVHGLVLSGGSAFGLSAADGAMAWLAGRGRGFTIGDARVPVVPAAVLFDLLNGGDKDWGETPPYRALGIAACEAASRDFAIGSVGAGQGARAGDLAGGLGSASFHDGETGFTVGAIAAVNSNGHCVVPDSPLLWAFMLEQDGEMGGQPVELARALASPGRPRRSALAGNTTLVAVATDAVLTKAQTERLAIMAHDGIARAIRPAHGPTDGDVVFALATGRRVLADPVQDLLHLGHLAADCTARAIARAIHAADDSGDLPCYRSLHGHHLRGGTRP